MGLPPWLDVPNDFQISFHVCVRKSNTRTRETYSENSAKANTGIPHLFALSDLWEVVFFIATRDWEWEWDFIEHSPEGLFGDQYMILKINV